MAQPDPNAPESALRKLLGAFEPVLTMGSSLVGSSLGGLSAMGGLLRGQDLETAAGGVGQIQKDVTYQPRTQTGKGLTEDLMGIMSGAGDWVDENAPYLSPKNNAQAVFEATKSPFVSALAETFADPTNLAPELKGPAAMMIGARGLRNLAPTNKLNDAAQAFKLARQSEPRPQDGLQAGWDASKHPLDRTPIVALYEGVDGKGRGEISDHRASIQNVTPGQSSSGTLGDILVHPELFQAYPQLKNTPVDVMDTGQYGGWVDNAGNIALSKGLDADALRSLLLHETQHKVQGIEGFARGGNPTEFKPTPSQLEDWYRGHHVYGAAADIVRRIERQQLRGGPSADLPALVEREMRNRTQGGPWNIAPDQVNYTRQLVEAALADPSLRKQFLDMSVDSQARYQWMNQFGLPKHRDREGYRPLAGEAEARQTQTRGDMGLGARLASYPDGDFDIPRESQLPVMPGDTTPALDLLMRKRFNTP